MSIKDEDQDYLTTQIITYLGNKRSLIKNIENEVFPITERLNKKKLNILDIFAGSGIVARMFKSHSNILYTNDLENYSSIINSCYLSNKGDFNENEYQKIYDIIQTKIKKEKVYNGIISTNYAPQNDENIKFGERVFYTHENAVLIDSYRNLIEKYSSSEMKKYFLAPLITEASIHTNTSGVFKGFYKDPKSGIGCFGGQGKNALPRIFGKVELKKPVFSNFESEVQIFKKDAVELSREVKNLDIAYLDPPYNQHPYGSNYFMLNLILKNKLDVELSKVSGITQDWNHSVFNKRFSALPSLEEIVSNIDSKFIIISYNSEGFITLEEMKKVLQKYGKLKIVEVPYNTFRGSRNLRSRDIHVSEYIFVLEKE